jgi:GDP-mannose 4,6-dehydratase
LPKRLREGASGFILHEGDITDVYALDNIIEKVKPDWVFHLASQSFVPYSNSNPLDTNNTNCAGTANLLEVLRKRAPQARIIFAGSSEEYGKQTEFPIDEDNPLTPNTLYGCSKVYGDLLCQSYSKNFGLHCVVSRAFNHEGWGRAPQFVTASIVRQMCAIKAGETTKLNLGDQSVHRDWSHVDDICHGYLLMAEKGQAGRVYVQGSGVATTVGEFLLEANEIINPGDWEIVSSVKPRPAEIPYLCADPSRIKQELGWKPRKGLTEIIQDLYEYYKIPENRSYLMV